MIKFFRKIRQQLLSENKFSKYLLYAAGEIILVVIGILIALQINTMRLDGINREIEENLLKSIQLEIEKDIEEFEFVKLFKKSQNESCLRLLNHYINNSEQTDDIAVFVNDLQLIQYFTLPSPHKASYETAINTGTINKITNKILVTEIANYYSNLGNEQHLTETKRFTNAYMENNLIKKYRLSSKYINVLDGYGGSYTLDRYKEDVRPVLQFQDIKEDISLENYLNLFSIRLSIGIKGLEVEQENAKKIIQRIASEIK